MITWTEFHDRSSMVRKRFVRGTLPNGKYLQMLILVENDKYEKEQAKKTIERALQEVEVRT